MLLLICSIPLHGMDKKNKLPPVIPRILSHSSSAILTNRMTHEEKVSNKPAYSDRDLLVKTMSLNRINEKQQNKCINDLEIEKDYLSSENETLKQQLAKYKNEREKIKDQIGNLVVSIAILQTLQTNNPESLCVEYSKHMEIQRKSLHDIQQIIGFIAPAFAKDISLSQDE